MYTVNSFALTPTESRKLFMKAKKGKHFELTQREQNALASLKIDISAANVIQGATIPKHLLAPLSCYGRLPISYFYGIWNEDLLNESELWLNLYENKFMQMLFKNPVYYTTEDFEINKIFYQLVLNFAVNPSYQNDSSYSEVAAYIIFLTKKARNRNLKNPNRTNHAYINIKKLIEDCVPKDLQRAFSLIYPITISEQDKQWRKELLEHIEQPYTIAKSYVSKTDLLTATERYIITSLIELRMIATR